MDAIRYVVMGMWIRLKRFLPAAEREDPPYRGKMYEEDDPDDGGNKAERIAMKAAGVIPEEESGKSGEDEAAAGTEAPLDEGEISGPAQTGVEEETEFSENPVEEESAYRTE